MCAIGVVDAVFADGVEIEPLAEMLPHQPFCGAHIGSDVSADQLFRHAQKPCSSPATFQAAILSDSVSNISPSISKMTALTLRLSKIFSRPYKKWENTSEAYRAE